MLSEKVKPIPIKGFTKDLINKFSVLNGAKYFSSGIFQNYVIFIKYFIDATGIAPWKSRDVYWGFLG